MSAPIYVIGHKNPDTDAICSALAYAWFLREQGQPDVEAACCGELNSRTLFALQEAGMAQPRLLMDVRPTIGQIAQRQIISAREDEPLLEVYRRMQKHHVRAVPALDTDGHLQGVLSFADLMELVLPDQGPDDHTARVIDTSLSRIAHVLDGTFVHAVEKERTESLLVMVAAMSTGAFIERLKQFPFERTIIVTGDRPTLQVPAIDYGVRCVIITGGYPLAQELIELAEEKRVSVIISPHDTATTTLLLRGSKIVAPAVNRSPEKIQENALIDAVSRKVQHSEQDLFPVVNVNDQLVGVFAKSDLVNPERTQLILVDHNEYAQAVTGADQARILEVIDHHRLGGGLMSREPIRFINEPVGSTCTIVTKFLYHRNLTPPRSIGVCLAAGIVSDTLNLSSPTTTDHDKRMLNWLASNLQLDVADFARRFFASGSILEQHTPDEAVRMDCKAYEENGWSFTVSQVEEMDLAGFAARREPLTAALENLTRERRTDFAALLVTDITRHYSLLMIAGSKAVQQAIDYPRRDDGLFGLEGVVSRKKQLLPHLIRTLSGIAR